MNSYLIMGLAVLVAAISVFGLISAFNARLDLCFRYFHIKNFTDYQQQILHAKPIPINPNAILPNTDLPLQVQFAQCFYGDAFPSANAPQILQYLSYVAYAMLFLGAATLAIGSVQTINSLRKKSV